jgi:hypothetical protein
MKKTTLISIGALILVVALAGCIGAGGDDTKTTGTGNGVAITDFWIEPTEIDANEDGFLFLEIENRGDYDATEVSASLIRTGAFSSADDYVYDALVDKPLGESILPFTYSWTVTAPNIVQDRTEELQGRVTYKYETLASAKIHFVPQDMIREQGREAFPAESISTAGPLLIEIDAGQPVILREAEIAAGSADKNVRIAITISNIGDGRVESEAAGIACSGEDLDCIDDLIIKGMTEACENLYIDAVPAQEGIRMSQGQEARKTWTETIHISDVNADTVCLLEVQAKYRYRVDSPIITVPVNAIE